MEPGSYLCTDATNLSSPRMGTGTTAFFFCFCKRRLTLAANFEARSGLDKRRRVRCFFLVCDQLRFRRDPPVENSPPVLWLVACLLVASPSVKHTKNKASVDSIEPLTTTLHVPQTARALTESRSFHNSTVMNNAPLLTLFANEQCHNNGCCNHHGHSSRSATPDNKRVHVCPHGHPSQLSRLHRG